MARSCPLCEKSNFSLEEKIRVADLTTLYNRMLNADISPEFGTHSEIDFCRCVECDLGFFYPQITGSESLYEKLQKFDWYYLDEKGEYDYARQFIKELDSVLEIGSGRGAFASKITSKSYLGLEFSREAKAFGEQDGVNIAHESIQKHACNNIEKYDVVCSFQVLEHVSDIRSFVESSVTCIRPGGLLIYSVPNADSFLSIVENGILNMPPHHVSWWSNKAIMKIAEIFDLEVIGVDHERLADIHLSWYATEAARKALKSKLGLKYRFVSMALLDRIIGKAASFMGRIYAKGLTEPYLRPIGHSVTVVYRKKRRGCEGSRS